MFAKRLAPSLAPPANNASACELPVTTCWKVSKLTPACVAASFAPNILSPKSAPT